MAIEKVGYKKLPPEDGDEAPNVEKSHCKRSSTLDDSELHATVGKITKDWAILLHPPYSSYNSSSDKK